MIISKTKIWTTKTSHSIVVCFSRNITYADCCKIENEIVFCERFTTLDYAPITLSYCYGMDY